jgi:AcrR family transcriptional regulator
VENINSSDKRRVRSERTRELLLQAAMRCYREYGISNTAMEDVAQAAGVGRATLYRHFRNQDALITEVVTANLEQIQALLKAQMQDCKTPEEFFVESAILIIRESRKRALTSLLFGDGSSASLINRISFSDPNIVAMGNDLIAPFYDAAKTQGILRSWVTRPLLQEWTSRLLLSFLMTPSPRLNNDRKMRKFFHEAVMPSIIQRSEPRG